MLPPLTCQPTVPAAIDVALDANAANPFSAAPVPERSMTSRAVAKFVMMSKAETVESETAPYSNVLLPDPPVSVSARRVRAAGERRVHVARSRGDS